MILEVIFNLNDSMVLLTLVGRWAKLIGSRVEEHGCSKPAWQV